MTLTHQWINESASSSLSLDGAWQFVLGGKFGTITTPGTWEAQGYPRRVDGPAVYRREVTVPDDWRGQRVQLQFDAVSYHVEARLNGVSVGEHSGMWTPFAFDVTGALRFGEANTLELTIYKPGERFPMREVLAGFLPDVCLPFGGVWQSARLVAFSGVGLSDLWVLADAATGDVRVEASLHSTTNAEAADVEIRILDSQQNVVKVWRGGAEAGSIGVDLHVDQPQRWSPESPTRYTAEISVTTGGTTQTVARRQFGFRVLSTQGDQLLFNDEPALLRGVLSWGWYPDLLCPAPDEATIRDEFRRVRALGYNMVKLCLFLPSPLYLEIADQEGMFLWLELPLWLPHVTGRLQAQAPHEYRDILAQAHNHPSIVIYSLGCELDAEVNADLLSQLNGVVRSRTCGVLACDNSGSGEAYGGLGFDYADFNDYHFYADLHYFTPLLDHFRRDWRPARPWIFGEFCDADDYRDLDEIAAAFDGDLPWWLTEQNPIHAITKLAYTEQRERMAALGDIGFSGQDIQRISRQQSFVIRKTILEKVRARRGMGGYVITGLRDTPLATSSMFDDLGRMKYDAEAFKAFNAESVLVLEQGRSRVWKNGGDRPAPVDRFNLTAGARVDYRVVLAHVGKPLDVQKLHWQLESADGRVASGEQNVTLPPHDGAPHEIAAIAFTAPDAAGEYQLAAQVGAVRNTWRLWVHPPFALPLDRIALHDPHGIFADFGGLANVARVSAMVDVGDRLLVTTAPDAAALDFVRQGGKAILLQAGAGYLPTVACPFWREAIKLPYSHPAWGAFPQAGYTDLQFYHLATDAALATNALAAIPDVRTVTPILRRLDARLFSLSEYLVELRIGAGVALASTLHFAGGAGDQVQGLGANVAGQHLLQAMATYLLGEGNP